MRKRIKRDASDIPTATLQLRTLRPPHSIHETLEDVALTTTFHGIKADLSAKTLVPTDKLRFLVKGKIVGDAKTVGEVVGEGEEVVVNVMLMGGAVVGKKPEVETETMEGHGEEREQQTEDKMEVETEVPLPTAEVVLKGDEFWVRLKAFLNTSIPTETEADEIIGVFRDAWEKRS